MNSKLKKLMAVGMAICMGLSVVSGNVYASGAESRDAKTLTDEITVTPDASEQNYTVSVKNLSETVTAVLMPVWSVNNGQDDIRWYTAKKVSENEWQCVVDIRNHGSDSGEYEVHVYGTLSDNSNKLLNGSRFTVSGITKGTVSCSALDAEKGMYRLEIADIYSPAGISKVTVPVWSEKNGQDDIRWYDAVWTNGKWRVDIDVSAHNFETGSYVAHVYATDNRGMQAIVGYKSFDVSAVKKNILSCDVNSTQSQVTVTLRNASLPAGTNAVYFPVWGNTGGQNDVIWYSAKATGANTYQATVPISSHMETGKYTVHAYAMGASGSSLLTYGSFSIQGISAKVNVVDKDDANGYFTVEISDVQAPAGIVSISVPVWSNTNGQDDIRWYTAQKSGDKWTVKVDITDHKLDTGIYNIHVYIKDSRGFEILAGNTTVNVKQPSSKPVVTCRVSEDTASATLTITNIIGADRVKVPVWAEVNGQNDICWYEAQKENSRTWTVTIPLGNHNETGKYQAHIYSVRNGAMELEVGTTFNVEKIIVNALSISSRDEESGRFSVSITNPQGLANISGIRIAVWSAIDGQDDLIWYYADRQGNTWTITVDPVNHNIDRGIYYVHAYAYNAAGETVMLGGLTPDVVITGNLGFVKDGNNVYYYSSLNNRVYGMQRINGQRYYFDESSGAMATGWKYVDGYKYYFDENGRMVQDLIEAGIIPTSSSFYLMINKQANCVTLYTYDPATNRYCIPVKAMLCSTGDATPMGTYNLGRTYRWLLMYNGTYCQFLSLIVDDFLIHSITYEAMNNRTLQTIGYNRLGVNKSAGCVRLRCGEAYLIYNLVNSGCLRQVTIYNSSFVGPFDRPYVAPIPDNQTWDPTDPTL